MKTYNKVIGVILLFLTSSVFAQTKDHKLIGHLNGSEIWEQNINKIHEYTIFTNSVGEDISKSSIKTTGKVTLTAYKYKGENSCFGISKTYIDFLNKNGYKIIFSCNNENSGKNIAEKYSKLNKLETKDNSLEPAFSYQDYFRNYISAKKQEGDKTTYICIFIAQGWWDFPVYRIDVIEKQESTDIIINDASNTSKNDKDQKIKNKKSFFYSIQAGLSSYNFFDSQLYGESYVIKSGQNSTSGTLSGYKNLTGAYIKGTFYINKNVGICADFAIHSVEHNNFVGDSISTTEYKTVSDLTFQRIGISGRVVGQDYPIKLQTSTGIGHGSFSAYYMIKTNISGNEYQKNYEGKADFPMLFIQSELTVPIIKGLFLFAEYEYTIAWSEELVISHGSGNDYSEIKINEPNYGGHNYRIGLGYEF